MTAAIRRSHDRSFLRLLVAAAALLLALGAAAPGGARAQAARGDNAAEEAAARQKLEAVRAEIRKLTDAQKAASLKRGDAATALRQADEAVAAAAKELRTLDGRLAAQQARLDELAAQRAALDARLEDQRAALAELVRSAYVMGRDEELKLLLAQDRIDIAGRLLVYYRYFERARLKEIEALLQGLAALARIEHAIADETAALGATRAARAAQLRELDGERSRRRQLLDAIDAELADQRSRLAALGKDEKSLLELLARLRDIFADIPKQLAGAEPFAQLRGRLRWPLVGRIVAAGGAASAEHAGLLIAAKEGSEVRAISHGRVVYADWLRGYGLLLILDHGDGYLSLYGYNESLLKDVGDWVDAGEPIATSGESGGQRTPGLYFELRHQGKPIDARAWLTPSSR
jgi:septal ring factor EnvC (AmiA/AmiB activator)